MILCYHEVVDEHTPLTPTAVRTSDLAAQFAWLKSNDYHPVSVDQILEAQRGGKPLPPNALLLTFDDGMRDVYTNAFPLLVAYQYPAVIALVSSWLEVPDGQLVDYDGQAVPRNQFVSWDDVRTMQASGLIEVASHSNNLHHSIMANPQGNSQPAAITHAYLNGQYENDSIYLQRIKNGLERTFTKHIGREPRIIVWPYGRSNQAARAIALQQGMPIGMTLIDGVNDDQTPLQEWKRHLIEYSPSLQSFAELLRISWAPDPKRSVLIDPGQWTQSEVDLSATLDRLLTLQPNIAFIKPSMQKDGQEFVFFPTPLRPLASDLLNQATWQIKRRTGVSVVIDLPKSWLQQPELVADLARHVNFAGLRLQTIPGSEAAIQIHRAATRWRLPLQMIYALETLPAQTVWDSLPIGDLIALPAKPELIANLPEHVKSQVLLEFDATQQPASEVADQMRDLEARGFRQFGLTSFPEQGMQMIAPALSLRSRPEIK